MIGRTKIDHDVSMVRSVGVLVGMAEGCAALQVFAVALAYPRGVLPAEADRFVFVP